MSERESIRVLEECIELQRRKSRDYQNDKSNVKQSMHYRRGVSTIHDMISQKLLRAQSLLESFENGDNNSPNFESLEDTYKDLINYASFAVSYIRGQMEGQDSSRDMINRPKLNIKEDKDFAVVSESEDDGFITMHGLGERSAHVLAILDIGDRIEGDYDELAKKISEK